MLAIIVAIGKNSEIGKNGKMPWHIKADLEYFKEKTVGHTIIMGRKTFLSLPSVLPERDHIILTKNKNFLYEHPRVKIVHDIDNILDEYKKDDKLHFVIGGGDIYKQALNFATYLFITKINKSFDADTFFPLVDYSQFELLESVTKEENAIEFTFCKYKRIS